MTAPSPTSVRVATLQSEQLILDFSRNQDSFAINSYGVAVPVDKSHDLYLRLDKNTASRVLGSEGEGFDWPDGADSPTGVDNVDEHDFQDYRTLRKAYAYRLGQKTVDEAEWNIVGQNERSKAQQAMTTRSLRAINKLTTNGNHDNSKAVSNKFDAGTVANPKLLKGLLEGYSLIHTATQGSVSPSDIVVVFNPDDARKIAATEEIREYVKHVNADALNKDFFSGRPDLVRNFGLPLMYGGFTLRVEDTVRNSGPKGNANKAYAWPSAKAVMLARPNGVGAGQALESFESKQSILGALSVFELENMTVEIRDDDGWNRRTDGRVVDDVAVEFTSPASACLFTGIMT